MDNSVHIKTSVSQIKWGFVHELELFSNNNVWAKINSIILLAKIAKIAESC